MEKNGDADPFEVIEDERGRYTSGADLVRPDREPDDAPQINPRTLMIWAGVVLVIAVIIAVPIIDRVLMRAPMTNLVAALKAQDFDKLKGSFTPDARIGIANDTMPAGKLISMAAPILRMVGAGGSYRFSGYSGMATSGWDRAEANFKITYDAGGTDDAPYSSVPFGVNGHVVLRREGLATWKIVQLTSDNDNFVDGYQKAKSADGLLSPDVLNSFY